MPVMTTCEREEVLLTEVVLTSAGLLDDSAIKVESVFTIRQDRVRNRLGTLTVQKLQEAFDKLIEALSA
jgi:mRNA-degrading endonuclease toxin of MazEF toxin-antitoxin module